MTRYGEPFVFDFDADDDAEHVAEPLRAEANLIRQRERTEHEHIAQRQRDRAWGRAVTAASMFSFASTSSAWPESVNGWTAPEFLAHTDWLQRTTTQALADGQQQQADHALHLRRLVNGETNMPHESRRATGRYQCGDSVIASALANGYGLDPRPEFLDAMARAGIIPSDAHLIGAGNVLHSFHVLGDAPSTANGWAILHRCPGAGSFGSWRTGAVHMWHAMPGSINDAAEQYADDLVRANASRGTQCIAA